MTDRNRERGEQRRDQRDPLAEREPQEEARRNDAPSREEGGTPLPILTATFTAMPIPSTRMNIPLNSAAPAFQRSLRASA